MKYIQLVLLSSLTSITPIKAVEQEKALAAINSSAMEFPSASWSRLSSVIQDEITKYHVALVEKNENAKTDARKR